MIASGHRTWSASLPVSAANHVGYARAAHRTSIAARDETSGESAESPNHQIPDVSLNSKSQSLTRITPGTEIGSEALTDHPSSALQTGRVTPFHIILLVKARGKNSFCDHKKNAQRPGAQGSALLRFWILTPETILA